MLLRDIPREFHDAIGLATKSSDRSGIVEGIACHSKPEDAPEAWQLLIFLDIIGTSHHSAHHFSPRKAVDAIDDNPNAKDGDEPITCVTKMLPQLDETDIEGQHHDYHGNDANDKKEVI